MLRSVQKRSLILIDEITTSLSLRAPSIYRSYIDYNMVSFLVKLGIRIKWWRRGSSSSWERGGVYGTGEEAAGVLETSTGASFARRFERRVWSIANLIYPHFQIQRIRGG